VVTTAVGVSTKACTKCHQVFPATTAYFRKDTTARSGVGARCKRCCAEENRLWKQQHPEQVRAQARRAYHRDPARHIQQVTQWIANNPEKRRATKRQWWEKHAERLNAQRRAAPEKRRRQFEAWVTQRPDYFVEWYARHQEQVLARAKERYEADIDTYRERGIHAASLRRQRIAALPNVFTYAQRQEALAFWHNCCAVCDAVPGEDGKALAHDHWIPLADTRCPGTMAWNSVPLCDGRNGCNTRKHDQDPYVFLLRHYSHDEEKAQEKLYEIEAFLLAMKEHYDV
jgi:hypothetical protein